MTYFVVPDGPCWDQDLVWTSTGLAPHTCGAWAAKSPLSEADQWTTKYVTKQHLPIIASDPEFLALWASPEDLSPHQVQLDIGTPEAEILSQATVQ